LKLGLRAPQVSRGRRYGRLVTRTVAARLGPDPLPIDLSVQGDEFLHRLQAELAGRGLASSAAVDRDVTLGQPIVVEMQPSGGSLSTSLVLREIATSVLDPVVSGPSNEAVEADLAAWREAVEAAIERLGAPPREFPWWAAIRTAPSASAQWLVQPMHLGEIHIHAASAPFVDVVLSRETPSLGYQLVATYPATITGRASGYSWAIAAGVASRQVLRLCATLTIAAGETWDVLSAPSPLQNVDDVPAVAGSRLPDAPPGDNWIKQEITLPSYTKTLWECLSSDERLDTAAHAFRQGALMEEDFPSAALIAYVGCIEGLGEKYVPRASCDCCDHCPMERGAIRRFNRALEVAGLPPDMRRYLKDLYQDRSSTAHAGAVHGGEAEGETGWPIIFSPASETFMFRHGSVRIARRAAREVLLHEILGERPAQLPPVPDLAEQFPRGLIAMVTTLPVEPGGANS